MTFKYLNRSKKYYSCKPLPNTFPTINFNQNTQSNILPINRHDPVIQGSLIENNHNINQQTPKL